MIVIRMKMHALPEKRKELVQTLLSIVGSIEKQPGCMSSTLFCNLEDKNLLALHEEWKSRTDLDHHLKSEIFGVLLGTKCLLKEPHDIRIDTIIQSEGMEAVHSAIRKRHRLFDEPFKT